MSASRASNLDLDQCKMLDCRGVARHTCYQCQKGICVGHMKKSIWTSKSFCVDCFGKTYTGKLSNLF